MTTKSKQTGHSGASVASFLEGLQDEQEEWDKRLEELMPAIVAGGEKREKQEKLKKDVDDAFPIRSTDGNRGVKAFIMTNPKAPIIAVSRSEGFKDRGVPVYFISAREEAELLIFDSAFLAELNTLTAGLAPLIHILEGSRTGSYFIIPFMYHMFPSAKAFHQAMENYLSQKEGDLGLCWVVENLHVSINHLGKSYEPEDGWKSLNM